MSMHGKRWLTKTANRGSPGKKKKKKKTPTKLNEVQHCDGEVRSRNIFWALESAGTGRYINDQNSPHLSSSFLH